MLKTNLCLVVVLFASALTLSRYSYAADALANPVGPRGPLTNRVVHTNVTVTNGQTNQSVSSSDLIYLFYDPFRPLADIETPDDLKLAVANLFFPIDDILFPTEESRIAKRRRRSAGLRLLTADELARYSDEAFFSHIRERNRRLFQLTEEERRHLAIGFEQWETKVIVSGWVNLRGGYGWVLPNESLPASVPGVTPGVNLNQNMRVNIVGKIGERVQVNINHSSESPDNEYEIAYKALESDDGFMRELRAGNISLNIPQSSRFVQYAGTSKDSYGVKSVLRFGDLSVQSVLNLTTSKKGYQKFVGRKRQERVELPDVNYVKRRYYLLPDTGIDSGSLELLQTTAATNIADRRIDSGWFRRLIAGQDFTVNLSTGELTLTNSLDRNTDLVVRYTRAGQLFTTNTDSVVGEDDTTGEKFLYLWKATMNFSQYIHYGTYNLGYQNFDPTRGFSLRVVYTGDKSKLAPVQFTSADYLLSPLTGILRFNASLPFPDAGAIYTNASDPAYLDSRYLMVVEFLNETKSFQLDYGIIPGTERILLNGRPLAPSEYTLLTATGELIFKNTTAINENDTIEAFYEYKPFWSGSQKFGLATRADWKPSNLFNLGGTVVYNVAQRDTGAPHISATPDGTLLADVDASANVARLLGLPEDLDLTVKGEVAMSLVDPNTVGYAIVDDFENAGDVFAFSKGEHRWILCSPTTNIAGIFLTNRGKLLYKDYRDYFIDGTFNLVNYTTALTEDKIKEYGFKPGPYAALGGHLNPAVYPSVSQSVLVFDYDFRDGGNWVGAAFQIAGPSGVDLSGYNEITVWARLQSDDNADSVYEDSGTGSVELFVAVGRMNEDADGNGLLDGEVDRAQAGYAFHDPVFPAQTVTFVGRGRQGGGDGYLQTEDLNRNGNLDTNESLVVFPGAGYTDVSNAVISQGDWRKITINIRTLSAEQVQALQHATALAVYVRNNAGAKGRVLIDTLEFKKVSWRDKRIDGVIANDSTVLSGDLLSVFNNPQYAANRFYRADSTDSNAQERAKLFEKLHGPRSVSEANQYNEKAIAVNYRLTNVPFDSNTPSPADGTGGRLVKRHSFAIDVSKYEFFNFYIYVPETDENGNPWKTGGDTYTNENFVLTMASSEKSFYQWSLPLDRVPKNRWQLVTIHVISNFLMTLDGAPVDGHQYPAITGYPNAVDVNTLEMGVETTSTGEPINIGSVWVNEMHVHQDRNALGFAFFVSPVLDYKKAVWQIGDLEILGPLTLRGGFENKDYQFVPMEGVKPGSFNNNFNASLSSSLFRDIRYTLSYDDNGQGTTTNTVDLPEYLQWDSRRNTFGYSVANAFRDFIPQISHSFTESFERRVSRALQGSTNGDFVLTSADDQYSGSARLVLNQQIPLGGLMRFSPRFSFEDSFYLYDRSSFTNGEGGIYLSNASIYGLRDRRKTLTAGLGFTAGAVVFSGDYYQTVDKYSRLTTLEGFRRELAAFRERTVFERAGQRFASAFQGFEFSGENLDKQNAESVTLSLSGDRPLPFFGFWGSGRLSRDAFQHVYDGAGNLTWRSERYNLGSDYKLNLYPKWWILDTIGLRVARDFEISTATPHLRLAYTNIFDNYAGVYYRQPFHFSGLIAGADGRTNSLELVRLHSEGYWNSAARLGDQLSAELLLSGLGPVWETFIPRRYVFSTGLSTARSQDSYSQVLNNQFDTSWALKVSAWGISFLQPSGEFRVGDVNFGLTLKNAVNYNDRKITDTLSGSVSESVWFSRTVNIFLSYTLSYSSEKFLTNTESYEARYGFTAGPPNQSPYYKFGHAGNLVLNWTVENVEELDFLLFRIDLHGSAVNNREGVLITAETLSYDGNQFVSYLQKIFELTFDHSTEFRFTDSISGSLIARAVVNRYAEVTPVGNQVRTSYFDPGFGLQLALDVRIRF